MSNSKTEHWVSAVIIDDDDYDEEKVDVNVEKDVEKNLKKDIEKDVEKDIEKDIEKDVEKEVFEIIPVSKKVKNKNVLVADKKKKNTQQSLKHTFDSDNTIIEIGIDEAGRGPMFGRVYAGVVVLPKDDNFDHSQMKDSKKFHSKKKIEQVAEYIKENAIAWAVEYEDEQKIDEINILQATQSAMHKGIKNVLNQLSTDVNFNYDKILLLVDGNYFKPLTILNKNKTKLETIKYQLVEGGDNKYTSIAAASILAKVSRDKYIDELCVQNPELIEHYGIDSNKGYGSKKHMDGIKKYGITKWHRKTFGICKEFC
jgi:ribonuclease HII